MTRNRAERENKSFYCVAVKALKKGNNKKNASFPITAEAFKQGRK